MKQIIEYYETSHSLDKTELPYSDELLVETIEKIVQKIGAIGIHLTFFDRDENCGGVWVSIYRTTQCRFGEYEVVTLHNITLCEETYRDCIKECQREKRILKQYFKHLKVTSNFK